ncbi:XerD/XerC family integrase (plasmid) [Halanaeroarchaeum sp. HSR-CO]|uniref:hypothetical protein n=1 Tax=Halanaeroarchaeum sp. HSR-CO TaxID=2866382 RepID=UPI00217E56C7|nr:hypothetical protein [Halanaeroarchaeum sp. HSR-CO]UWG49157.1 XerD/XerC family integrase [Halanaeroarchaeum sp. HSR-CO]
MPETRHWSKHSLDELRDLYLDELAAELREDEIDPFEVDATTITRRYRGLDYALREHHDMTVSEFLTRVCGVSRQRHHQGSPLEDATADTREAVEDYLGDLEQRRKLDSSSVDANRTALSTVIKTYADVHGRADLLAGAAGAREQHEEVDRVLGTFDVLDEELSDSTLIRYRDTLSRWYEAMQDRGRVEFNPVDAVANTFGWTRESRDPKALEAADVRALYACTESREEALLIVALAGWGLRPNEVAALHARQLVLDEDDPHLEFDEGRKNGPGTVALLVGLEELATRLDDLAVDDWNGYVFPSSRSETGHIAVDTVRNRFRALADRADVTVDGDLPVPKMGRRYWYQAYSSAQAEVLDLLEEIAGDQGSASAAVVQENYLDEERRRELRRRAMRNALEGVFS